MLSSQPKGLYTLCFTELWERFGFYMVQMLIVLFLTRSMHFSEGHADLLYGAFGGLLYVSPVIGGWLADHYIGFRRAVIVGAVLLFVGYSLLMVPTLKIFYLGLAILIVGNGLLKPCISSMVGTLYKNDEAKREGGFTLFYIGINLGGIIPPLIAGTVIKAWGWHYGFGLAAGGMIVALLTFTLTSRVIWQVGSVPKLSPLIQSKQAARVFNFKFTVGIILFVALFYWGVLEAGITDWIITAAAIVFTLYVLWCLRKEDVVHQRRLIGALILIVFSIGFWMLYAESFSSMMLFAASNINLHIFGISITPEFTQFYNSAVIILFGPFFNWLWQYLDRKHCNPSIPLKFAFGMGLMCLGFVLLVIATNSQFATEGKISDWWLMGSYILQTFGELCLSPIGLAMITMLAPKHLVGLMMGMWFFVVAGATAISGMLANLAAVPHGTPALDSLSIYHHAFSLWSFISATLVVISFVIYPFVKRLIAIH